MFLQSLKSKDNVFALALFILSMSAFFVWGYNYIPTNHLFLFILASVFGIFMAFNIGGNDVANSFGTSVGAKTLTIKQALVIAAVFELSGAMFAGGEVTNTIRNGLVAMPEHLNITPMSFAVIMMSALLSAGLWLFIATKIGAPVSTTHSIVGGIVGGSLTMGFIYADANTALEMVKWNKVFEIVSSWFLSPLAGGILAYFIYRYVKTKIIDPSVKLQDGLKVLKQERKKFKNLYINELEQKSPEEQIKILKNIALSDDSDQDTKKNDYIQRIEHLKENEKNYDVMQSMKFHIPIIGAFGAMIIACGTLFRGLKHLNLNLNIIEYIWIVVVIGVAAYLISLAVINLIKKDNAIKGIDKLFSWFQIFTASSFAFSHGANDIANAIGPFVAILDILKTDAINENSSVPFIAMVTFGIALVVGLWFLGKEVITTVGTKIATIKPTTGFSAELSSSFVILIATQMGLPISSTHVLIGAILGIGIYNKDANWGSLKQIGLACVVTIPVAMVGSAISFMIIGKIVNIF